MEHDLYIISNDFWHKIKRYNFDSYNVLLVIATNIPVLLMTASVLQGHISVTLYYMEQFSTKYMLISMHITSILAVSKTHINVLFNLTVF